MLFNVTVPDGTTNHGNPKLVCMPTQWSDILFFFAGNYVAHAFTITGRPGQSFPEAVFFAVNALFVPGFASIRTLSAIGAHAGFPTSPNSRGVGWKDAFRKAATAGALCMVVHTDHFFGHRGSTMSGKTVATGGVEMMPLVNTTWFHRAFLPKPSWRLQVPDLRRIHGFCHLPANYLLVEVPAHIPLRPCAAPPYDQGFAQYSRGFGVANSYNIPKVLISLFQVVWGALTLYHARGDQMLLYGYSAFGLSVAPYVIMSIMNALANLVTPEYPCMYLVESPDMDRARAEGGRFDGAVAAIDYDAIYVPLPLRNPERWGNKWIRYLLSLMVGVLPIAVALGLSHARTGGLTSTELSPSRWVISWLVIGSLSGPWVIITDRVFKAFLNKRWGSWRVSAFAVFMYLSVAPLWIASAGGMIVVGHQLVEYGTCIRLD